MLNERLAELARTPQLLVACDYDGTVAPVVDDPMAASPRRETVAAMRALAELGQTHVAVISGRSLRDLAALSRLPHEIHLVGSHGSEFDVGFAGHLDASLRERRTILGEEVHQLTDAVEGAFVEHKPASLAVHLRRVADADAVAALTEALGSGPGAAPDVHTRVARDVIELSVIKTDKGRALEAIRSRVGASAVIFLGDDVSDEDAFATLAGPDVGVKVGPGDSIAEFRVEGTEEVGDLLGLLAALREEWLTGSAVVPITDHSILSDQRTIAVVTPSARVTWLCLPRIDSSGVFAELVGGPSAGYFAIESGDSSGPTRQRYVDDSMVLETTYPSFTVTDYLDVSDGRIFELAHRTDLVRVLEGSGVAEVTFSPKIDFGRLPTRLEARPNGVVIVSASEQIALYSPGVEWTIAEDGEDQLARASIDLTSRVVVLELRSGTDDLEPHPFPEEQRRAGTARHWARWADQLRLPEVAPDVVKRSALMLRSLVHGPTGAIVAAGTTSLPEHIGGVRNWDYRYCWVRDAAWSAHALVRLGSNTEAVDLLEWLLEIIDRRGEPERLQPLYNVTGRHLPPEAELASLSGYAGSRPVRIGNAAEGQVQLDEFGPIVDLMAELAARGVELTPRHMKLIAAFVQAVAMRWHERDHGIWEQRKRPREHVYSRVMCWVAVDRAIAIHRSIGLTVPEDWQVLRDAISTEVMAKGWNDDVRSFTAAYDGDDLDSSVLAVGLWRMCKPDDPRFLATVESVERRLRDGGTVHRYLTDDGLPGMEGGFHLMTAWLIDSYLLVGRIDDARELFDHLLEAVGPTGVLSEEIDPDTGKALGNFPQAYSHLGLVNSAINLSVFAE